MYFNMARSSTILLIFILTIFTAGILVIGTSINDVYAQTLVTIYVKYPDNSPCVFCTVISSSGSVGLTDSYGKINLVLEYNDYVYVFNVFVLNDIGIIYSYGTEYKGGDKLEIVVKPYKCFYPINFSITPQVVSPDENVTIEFSWIFAKCCPNCIVYVTLYLENNFLTNIWSDGDYGYTHKLIKALYTFKAPQNTGTYRITINVAYAYQPPSPNEGIVKEGRLYVITPNTTTYTITKTTTVTSPITYTTTDYVVEEKFVTVTNFVTVKHVETITQTYELTNVVEKEVSYTITLTDVKYVIDSITYTTTYTIIKTLRTTVYTDTLTTTFTGLINMELTLDSGLGLVVAVIIIAILGFIVERISYRFRHS
ncbi:MAG: hypothetical protein QXX12_07195 [Nanopusillaceae archaeon]